MQHLMRGSLSAWIGAGILALTLADMLLRPTAATIASGEPFIYWAYVDVVRRPPLLLLALVLLGAWIGLRRLWRPAAFFTPLAVTLLVIASVLFGLVAPLTVVSQPAIHVRSALVENNVYHLYYETSGLLDLSCRHVVVRCGRVGVHCEYVDGWVLSPVCLGSYANIQLLPAGNTLSIRIGGEIVRRIRLE